MRNEKGLVSVYLYDFGGEMPLLLGSWYSDDVETAKDELRKYVRMYNEDGLKSVLGEILVGGKMRNNGFHAKKKAEVVYAISNNKDIDADEYVGVNESRRFRGRRLNERKSYSVFADGGLGGRDEYRDFDSEEEAGRFADSLDKRKFKGYRISDPEGDVIADRTYLHGKREIFTYSLCNIDEETGDHETYYESNPFYDFDECCDAAKEAVKKETEPVISFVFAGEYVKDNGDIYGDTTAVLAISNTRSVNADEYV